MPRWTTAREVSGGAVLMLRVASPTLEPSRERTGRVEVEVVGRLQRIIWEVFRVWVWDRRRVFRGLRGMKAEMRGLGFWRGNVWKIEDEKQEIEGEAVQFAMRERERGSCYLQLAFIR